MKPKHPPVILNTNNPERIPYRLYRDRIEAVVYIGAPLFLCIGVALGILVRRIFGA